MTFTIAFYALTLCRIREYLGSLVAASLPGSFSFDVSILAAQSSQEPPSALAEESDWKESGDWQSLGTRMSLYTQKYKFEISYSYLWQICYYTAGIKISHSQALTTSSL